jgi:hypothetical protein
VAKMQKFQTRRNGEKFLYNEKVGAVDSYKQLILEHNRLKTLINDLYFDVNKKEILLKNQNLEPSRQSMLKYDFRLSQKELEKSIYQKELLRKDITILQHRMKHLENEIRKTKPWWQRLFPFV